MNKQEMMELGELMFECRRAALNERLIIRYFEKGKLTEKEISRRVDRTLDGISNTYERDVIGKRLVTEKYYVFVCFALRDGLEIIDTQNDEEKQE
jgi:hypothetical protein